MASSKNVVINTEPMRYHLGHYTYYICMDDHHGSTCELENKVHNIRQIVKHDISNMLTALSHVDRITKMTNVTRHDKAKMSYGIMNAHNIHNMYCNHCKDKFAHTRHHASNKVESEYSSKLDELNITQIERESSKLKP